MFSRIFFSNKYNLKLVSSYASRSDKNLNPSQATTSTERSYWKNGRIIPLDMSGNKKIDQMANYFYSDNRIRSFFAQQNQSTRMNRDLFYVYEDKDGKIKEVKLKKSSVALSKDKQDELEILQNQIQQDDLNITKLSPGDRQILKLKYNNWAPVLEKIQMIQ